MTLLASFCDLLPEAFRYGFFRRAFLATALLAPMLSAIGCMVVEARMAFFSDAVGHAGLAGIAIATLLGLADPLAGLVGFSVLIAIGTTWARRRSGLSTDTAIGVAQSASVALGIVILSRDGGFARFSRYLIGDLLAIGAQDLVRLAIAVALFVPVWALLFNRALVASLGESFARSRGVSPGLSLGAFAVLAAVVISLSIQWIGILVIQALMVLPAAAARNFARSTASYHWTAVVIGTGCGFAGLFASWAWSTATGATIVLFCFAVFLVSLAASRRG